jgi:hypothetical protein
VPHAQPSIPAPQVRPRVRPELQVVQPQRRQARERCRLRSVPRARHQRPCVAGWITAKLFARRQPTRQGQAPRGSRLRAGRRRGGSADAAGPRGYSKRDRQRGGGDGLVVLRSGQPGLNAAGAGAQQPAHQADGERPLGAGGRAFLSPSKQWWLMSRRVVVVVVVEACPLEREWRGNFEV